MVYVVVFEGLVEIVMQHVTCEYSLVASLLPPPPSCSDLQMHGGPVDGVLPCDPREEPLSGHEVVSALL